MIKKDIFNKNMKGQFQASAKDRIYRFIMADEMIKGAIVHSTRMVNEMRANHETGLLETMILGQAYIAVCLICSGLKGKHERLSMDIQCSGPIQGLDVEGNVFGEVRGYLARHPFAVENPERLDSQSQLFGAGFLTVTRYPEDASTPYSGKVTLEHGNIAEDLANYFLISEQIPTAFKLSVFFDGKGEVQGAGGIFLQAMPNVDIKMVSEAENIIRKLESLGELFSRGQKPEEIILDNFSCLAPKILHSDRVEFLCRCSRDKMKEYLQNMPREDKKNVMETGVFPLEIRCHHCNSIYRFEKNDLLELVGA